MTTISQAPQPATLPRVTRWRGGARRTGFRMLRLMLLLGSVVVFLLPVYVLLVTSFKPLAEADPSRAWLLPSEWTTEGWSAAWSALAPGLWNSVKLAVPGAVISAALGSMAAPKP